MLMTDDEFLKLSREEQARILAEWEDEFGPIDVGGTLRLIDKKDRVETKTTFPDLSNTDDSDNPLRNPLFDFRPGQ